MPHVSRDGRLSDKSKTACFTVTKSTKWKIVTFVPTPTNQAIVIIPVFLAIVTFVSTARQRNSNNSKSW